MEAIPFLLQQEFNKLYPDIVNSEIIPPPYYSGRVPQNFFLRKRWWLEELYDFWLDEIFDIEEIWVYIYWIGRDWTDVKVVKIDTTVDPVVPATLYTGTYATGINYSFKYITSVSWTVVYSWSSYWAVSWTDDLFYKTWTYTFTSADIGRYIYVYDDDPSTPWWAWAWQILRITGIDWWWNAIVWEWKVPPGAVGTKMLFKLFWYNSVTSVLSFIWGSNLQVIHNDTTILPVVWVSDPIDFNLYKWRLYILASNGWVFVSEAWFYNAYFWLSSFIGSSPSAFNIIDFQDFVLILWKNFIDIVKTDTVQIWTTSEIKTYFSIANVSRSHGIYQQNSFNIYNQWLYVFTKNKQFIALSITSAWFDKYVVNEQNQWIYIQKFLDNFDTTDTIRLTINDQFIYLFEKTTSSTIIFIYDIFYKWWHRRTTDLPITKYKTYFIWDTLYSINDSVKTDEWVVKYTQDIQVVVWEDSTLYTKRCYFVKMVITAVTTKKVYANFKIIVWWDTYEIRKDLSGSWYLIKASTITNIDWDQDPTLWTNMLWYELLNWWVDIDQYVWMIANIEIPTWFFHELFIIDIVGEWVEWIEFWWLMVWQETLLPQITALDNVI